MFTIPRLYIENVALVNLAVEEAHLEFERYANLKTNKSLESLDPIARIVGGHLQELSHSSIFKNPLLSAAIAWEH